MSWLQRSLVVWCRHAGLVLAGVLFFGLVPAFAQPPSCAPGNSPKGSGEDIKCKLGDVLDKSGTLLTNLENRLANCQGARCDLLRDRVTKARAQHGRAVTARNRATGKDFEDLHIVRKAKCRGKASDCSNGNEGMGGAVIEGGESDPAIGEEIADQLDQIADGIDQTNELLTESSPESSLGTLSLASTTSGAYDFTQDPNYPNILNFEVDPRVSVWARLTALTLTEVAEWVKDATGAACNQVVVAAGFGGNAAAFCTPLEIAFHVVKIAKEYLNFWDGEWSSWETHGAYVRAGEVHGIVSNLQVSAGNTDVALAALQSDITSLQEEVTELQTALQDQLLINKAILRQIIALMLVPDGKRVVNPLVLTCTGANCPNVLACPGDHCAFSPR